MRRETLNTRGAIKDLKVSVRLVTETSFKGTDVKGFWEALGFHHERESVKSGVQYAIHTLGSSPLHVSPISLLRINGYPQASNTFFSAMSN